MHLYKALWSFAKRFPYIYGPCVRFLHESRQCRRRNPAIRSREVVATRKGLCLGGIVKFYAKSSDRPFSRSNQNPNRATTIEAAESSRTSSVPSSAVGDRNFARVEGVRCSRFLVPLRRG